MGGSSRIGRSNTTSPPPGFSSGNAYWNKEKRTTSFTNLAAVVGTGLAESMDDSTRAEMNSHELSYARQSRHAASRKIGNITQSSTHPLSGMLLSPQLQQEVENRTDHSLYSQQTITNSRKVIRGRVLDGGNGAQSSLFQQQGMVGVTVMEPNERGRSSAPPQLFEEFSGPGAPNLDDLQNGIHTLSIDANGNNGTAAPVSSSAHSMPVQHVPVQHTSLTVAEAELAPYLWDIHSKDPSRSLALLRVSSLHLAEIRSHCEACGVLEMFRADFAQERGVVFVGYYDIRSAQYAATELQSCFNLLSPQAQVRYCVPLSSSSPTDESVLVLNDLPEHLAEETLMGMLSSYGAVRSLRLQPMNHYGGKTYVVEFHDVQDAKQALMELESTQPWGKEVLVEVGTRRAIERKRGRELLGLIGRWRHGNRQGAPHHEVPLAATAVRTSGGSLNRRNSTSSRSSSPAEAGTLSTLRDSECSSPSHSSQSHAAQVVIGPDGRYSYMLVNHSAFQTNHTPAPGRVVSHQQQQIVHGLHGTYLVPHQATSMHYWPHHQSQQPSQSPNQTQFHHVIPPSPYGVETHIFPQGSSSSAPSSTTGVPYFAQMVTNQTDSSVSSGSQGTNVVLGIPSHPRPRDDGKDNRHLFLNIEAVESGRDTRTSLMVRNIPNKYTQQMLLSEFKENGHGPGKIDFFYLPIDFKNKCNRGYAFINFVDYRDIVFFYRQYFGQHWRIFNSDKICDITYARIQGKAGMLKRFENSALMEKDEEYKPLVFVSHGADKGKRLSFPVANSTATKQTSHGS